MVGFTNMLEIFRRYCPSIFGSPAQPLSPSEAFSLQKTNCFTSEHTTLQETYGFTKIAVGAFALKDVETHFGTAFRQKLKASGIKYAVISQREAETVGQTNGMANFSGQIVLLNLEQLGELASQRKKTFKIKPVELRPRFKGDRPRTGFMFSIK